MDHLDDLNELARTAPTLHGLPKVDPFVVPDGFFERFPHAVGDAIAARERRVNGVWRPWMRWALAVPPARSSAMSVVRRRCLAMV